MRQQQQQRRNTINKATATQPERMIASVEEHQQ